MEAFWFYHDVADTLEVVAYGFAETVYSVIDIGCFEVVFEGNNEH